MKTLLRGTVWEKGALDGEPKKYRSLVRFWLPLYDVIAIAAGIFAVWVGSSLLDRIYGDLTDAIGTVYALVAALCFIGVAYPKLWMLEVGAKITLLGMLFGYVAAILWVPSPQQLAFAAAPSYFVAAMLCWGVPMAGFRLTQLAIEEYERQVAKRVQEIRDANQ
ncbi:membrane protein [Microbacterium phage CrunchyBoi]|nr:membrane protein [Microbacterium phage CrunchyBoi]